MLVSTVVIEDEMQIQMCKELSIQPTQKQQELLIAMTRHAMTVPSSIFNAANNVVVPCRL
jgi:hypothetical protein